MSAIYYKGKKYTGPTLDLGSGSLTTNNKTIVGAINEISSSINILNTALENKQNTLVSGTNIKTINGTSLLGSGDCEVATYSTTDLTAGSSALTTGRIYLVYE